MEVVRSEASPSLLLYSSPLRGCFSRIHLSSIAHRPNESRIQSDALVFVQSVQRVQRVQRVHGFLRSAAGTFFVARFDTGRNHKKIACRKKISSHFAGGSFEPFEPASKRLARCCCRRCACRCFRCRHRQHVQHARSHEKSSGRVEVPNVSGLTFRCYDHSLAPMAHPLGHVRLFPGKGSARLPYPWQCLMKALEHDPDTN